MSTGASEHARAWLGEFGDLVPLALTLFCRREQTVVVEWVNRSLATFYRTEPREFAGRRLDELYPAGVVERIVGWLGAADRDGRVRDEIERELPAGRVTAQVTTVALGDGRYLSYAVDVTTQRDAERDRAQLAAMTGIGTYRWSVASGQVSWSRELFELLGHEPGSVTPSIELFLSHVHPDDLERLESNTVRAAGGDMVLHDRFRIVRVDGAVRDVEVHSQAIVDDDAALLHVLGAIQDVTDRFQLERQAALGRQATERQQTALQVHDRIVQGLATAWLALDVGEYELAATAIEEATGQAQQIVQVLLGEAASLRGGIQPGDLVRADPSGSLQEELRDRPGT